MGVERRPLVDKSHPTMKPPEPTEMKINSFLSGVNDDPVSRTWVMVTPVGSLRLAKVMVALLYFVFVASTSV